MISVNNLPLHAFIASVLFITAISASASPEQQRDPADPANRGRAQLTHFLDTIAAADEATRAVAVTSIHTRAQAEARQVAVRNQILSLLGPLPQRTPLNDKILGETQANGFRIQKILFESQPGFFVTALLYLPDGQPAGQKLPAILMAPGHYATGKAFDYPAAAFFARNGFVVLSYDPIGQGERHQFPDPARPGVSLAGQPTGEHGEASLQPMLIGDTFARYILWDSIRSVDYLAQLPQVDAKRIGAFGCSGGGIMTAFIGALDSRVAAIGSACYITSFDKLLPSMGPQDAEQSSPRFVSSGLDFPDWIESAAPRPYAIVATYSDMFPFAGTIASVTEARRFYSIFDSSSAGTPTGSEPPSIPPTPTGPALNADTTNNIPFMAPLQLISGPGRHAALAPIMGDVVSFFIRNLKPGTDASHLVLPPATAEANDPFAGLSKDALQVTPTGQIATSYPGAETVSSLNRQRFAQVVPVSRPVLTGAALSAAIRKVTGSTAQPGASKSSEELLTAKSGSFVLPVGEGMTLQGEISVPSGTGRHPSVLLLVPDSIRGDNLIARANKARFDTLAAAGNVVLALTPRPSPPGTDDMKSPLLGPFYLLSLRAYLVGRTLVGLRMDDVLLATDYLASRPDVDPARISAVASGHLGLVLLHAAILDQRLGHVTVDHVLTSYRSLIDSPLPIGAPEDILSGVLLHYDIPDLVQALSSRLTLTESLQGTDDLSQSSTPLSVRTPPSVR